MKTNPPRPLVRAISRSPASRAAASHAPPVVVSRRDLLRKSLTAGAAIGLTGGVAGGIVRALAADVRGANERLNVAVVGLNGRGKDHIKGLSQVPGVKVVALCDADRKVLDAAVKAIGTPVLAFTDVRQVLERHDIDAVSTATPNHWHALVTVWAAQAGKDVYVEKPVSHNLWEGRQAVEAGRKYNRVVQAGMQCRSSRGLQEAVAWVKAGNLGRIKWARGLCYKARPSIGKVDSPQPIPPSVDYDLWCGPAPLAPLMRKRLHYDWHWVWATGNGDLGNQGVHQMDIARWFLGEAGLCPRVLSVGGRLGYVDDGQTPNTQIIFCDYAAAPLIFEVRGLPTKEYRGTKVGVVVECEGGSVVVPNYTDVTAFDKAGKEMRKWTGGGDHFANWAEACRTRRTADLAADLLDGHVSSGLCHLGNISYRVGAPRPPEAIREMIGGSGPMSEAYDRMASHLRDNGVDLSATPAMLGAGLEVDAKAERFTGAGEAVQSANALLTRAYRAPFVVPERV